MKAPWRKSNPVGPETISPDDGVDQRTVAVARELVRDISELSGLLRDAKADADYWRGMYYSVVTLRDVFEAAVEETGWEWEECGPGEWRPIPNTPDYLGECPPLEPGDVRLLYSYHEGPGL